MNENSARVARWWQPLDQSEKQTLLDLKLEEGDKLPEEFVPGLQDHGIWPVEWKSPRDGYVAPGELIEFLARQRDQNA